MLLRAPSAASAKAAPQLLHELDSQYLVPFISSRLASRADAVVDD